MTLAHYKWNNGNSYMRWCKFPKTVTGLFACISIYIYTQLPVTFKWRRIQNDLWKRSARFSELSFKLETTKFLWFIPIFLLSLLHCCLEICTDWCISTIMQKFPNGNFHTASDRRRRKTKKQKERLCDDTYNKSEINQLYAVFGHGWRKNAHKHCTYTNTEIVHSYLRVD